MGKVLGVVDWIVIGIYFGICVIINIVVKFRKKENILRDYFLAGRSMTWFFIACSLYASNMGTGLYINLAESGASNGIAVITYEWHAVWVLLLLGFFFLPIYIGSDVLTMPEYLRCRFRSKWIEIYMSVICIVNSMFTTIAIDVYAAGLFLKQTLNFNMYLSSVTLLSVTAIYTLIGGLPAVMYTDTMQCILMISGAVTLSVISLNKVGGFTELWNKYPHAVGKAYNGTVNFTSTVSNLQISTTTINDATVDLTSAFFSTSPVVSTNMFHNVTSNGSFEGCYNVDKNWDHVVRPITDNEFPWIGVLFSLPITCIWYWCTDQMIVQRTLSAKNLLHARTGTIIAGFLKLFPLFLMIMPGMAARVLYPDVIACPDSVSCQAMCGNEVGCSHVAYSQLVVNLLPYGIKGLMFVVVLASLMSSMSSVFNSASTVFTMNIWKGIRPYAQDQELLIVGRVTVIVMVIVGIAWIPIVKTVGNGELLTYFRIIQSYLAPPICAVFFMGMISPRVTESGAIISMLIGLLLALVRFSFDIAYPYPECGYIDDRPLFVKLHFMYFSLIIFMISVISICVVSIISQPVPLQMLGKLTWETMTNPKYIDENDGDVNQQRVDIGMDNIDFIHSRESVQHDNSSDKTVEIHSNLEKWLTRLSVVVLLTSLLAFCIYFR